MTTTARHGDWIQLISGEPFWPLDARAEEIHIADIAWALSMQCRFAGHVQAFYSVAEHSVMVSRIVSPEHALWGLLHDATEAYLVDLPRPIKNCMPEYKSREHALARVVADRFGLPWPMPPEVKQADVMMLWAERDQLLAESRRPWGYPQADLTVPPLPNCPHPELAKWTPGAARAAFLDRFAQLGGAS